MRVSGNPFKCLLLAGTLFAGSPGAGAAFKKAAVEVKTSFPAQTLVGAEVPRAVTCASITTQLSAKPQRRLTRKAIWTTLKQGFRRVPGGGYKSQLVALLLCLFLGSLGIHRFYLDYIVIGILQLLAFLLLPTVILVAILAAPAAPIITLGVVPLFIVLAYAAWILIDLVRIATGDLKPKGSSYDRTL